MASELFGDYIRVNIMVGNVLYGTNVEVCDFRRSLVEVTANVGEGELNLFRKFIILIIVVSEDSVVGVDIESLSGSNNTCEGSSKLEHIFVI